MASNDAATALPPKDFLVKDYELKVRYLTDHFGRMWTRFNYFVGIETAHIGGKLIFGNGKLSPEVAVVGTVVSLIWYVMGAEDRFLVRLYCGHVKDAADLLAEGDRVVARIEASGTHQGEWAGIAATGRHFTISGMVMRRIANGKIVARWDNLDMLAVMQQIGAIPAPPPPRA